MLRDKIHKINITEFTSDSVERALMFLLGLQSHYHTDKITKEDQNVLKALEKNNIEYKIIKSPNNRIVVQV